MAQRQSEILGTTTVTDSHRISLISAVREKFDGVDIGDRLVYRYDEGRVVIELA